MKYRHHKYLNIASISIGMLLIIFLVGFMNNKCNSAHTLVSASQVILMENVYDIIEDANYSDRELLILINDVSMYVHLSDSIFFSENSHYISNLTILRTMLIDLKNINNSSSSDEVKKLENDILNYTLEVSTQAKDLIINREDRKILWLFE